MDPSWETKTTLDLRYVVIHKLFPLKDVFFGDFQAFPGHKDLLHRSQFIANHLLRINNINMAGSRFSTGFFDVYPPRVKAMQVPKIPNQRSAAVLSSTFNRKALGGNRLKAHSRLLTASQVSYNPFSS